VTDTGLQALGTIRRGEGSVPRSLTTPLSHTLREPRLPRITNVNSFWELFYLVFAGGRALDIYVSQMSAYRGYNSAAMIPEYQETISE
jgi:hypothetical protein